jgi:signal recognition particle receptor subunit beta
MVFFNYALRKLNAKIVYYGPGLCGKTTNLAWIHDNFEGGDRGKMISLATEGDRTIFFDLLPLEIGSIRGMDVTLQLYTVPGQVHYNSTRQLVLRGADGVVFVADSQQAMKSSNIESFRNLQENLLLQGISLEGFPLVLQFNKRDLKEVLPVEELDGDLNIFKVPIFEAVATEGVGVQETLEGIVKLVMRNLRQRYEGAAADSRSPGGVDPAATMRASPGSARRPEAATLKPTPAPQKPPAEPPKQQPPAAVSPPAQQPPAIKRPAPAAPPQPSASAPPPVERKPPAAVPPEIESPVEEIVFPEENDAKTADFSGAAGAGAETPKPGFGFEDEVTTSVYHLGEEIEVGPEDFSPADGDGDVFESPSDSPIGETTGPPASESAGVFEPPQPSAAPPAMETPAKAEARTPAAATPFDEPEDSEESVIEFVTDDSAIDAPPPAADLPPADRYVDRIVAPSPFAPREGGAQTVGDAGIEGWTDEDSAAIADLTADIVVDESSDGAIEAPSEEVEYDEMTSSAEQPRMVGGGDPFAEPGPVPEGPAAIERSEPHGVSVRAGDNQLQLRLQGTGAVMQSGQVRELDIEVPVPGAWVGHRKVTLQLRLTLTPDTEDENGGSGETP